MKIINLNGWQDKQPTEQGLYWRIRKPDNYCCVACRANFGRLYYTYFAGKPDERTWYFDSCLKGATHHQMTGEEDWLWYGPIEIKIPEEPSYEFDEGEYED